MKRRARLLFVVFGIGLTVAVTATVWWFAPARWFSQGVPQPKTSVPSPHGPVRAVAFSPDGRQVVAATGAAVMVLERGTWQTTRLLDESGADILCLAYSPDGTMLATGRRDGQLAVWDSTRWEPRRTLQEGVTDPPGRFSGVPRAVTAVCFSPDGRTLAAGNCLPPAPHLGPGEVYLFDAATGDRTRTLAGHKAGETALAFSPDGTRLASSDEDTRLKLWDMRTGALQQGPPKLQPPVGMAFDPTGRAVIYGGGWSQEVEVATVSDLSAGSDRRIPGTPLNGRLVYVLALALSSDGRTLATGEMPKDGSGYRVRLWDVATGQPAGVVKCRRQINALAFSPDGGELVAGCGEHGPGEVSEVCVWDVPPRPAATE